SGQICVVQEHHDDDAESEAPFEQRAHDAFDFVPSGFDERCGEREERQDGGRNPVRLDACADGVNEIAKKNWRAHAEQKRLEWRAGFPEIQSDPNREAKKDGIEETKLDQDEIDNEAVT